MNNEAFEAIREKHMRLAPKKNFAVIVATNIAGADAEKGTDQAAAAMIRKWLGK